MSLIPSWIDLAPEQRCILYEGTTGNSLVGILGSWVAVSRPADGPYWNRTGVLRRSAGRGRVLQPGMPAARYLDSIR